MFHVMSVQQKLYSNTITPTMKVKSFSLCTSKNQLILPFEEKKVLVNYAECKFHCVDQKNSTNKNGSSVNRDYVCVKSLSTYVTSSIKQQLTFLISQKFKCFEYHWITYVTNFKIIFRFTATKYKKLQKYISVFVTGLVRKH